MSLVLVKQQQQQRQYASSGSFYPWTSLSADKLAGMEGKGQTEMRGWLLARSVVDYILAAQQAGHWC